MLHSDTIPRAHTTLASLLAHPPTRAPVRARTVRSSSTPLLWHTHAHPRLTSTPHTSRRPPHASHGHCDTSLPPTRRASPRGWILTARRASGSLTGCERRAKRDRHANGRSCSQLGGISLSIEGYEAPCGLGLPKCGPRAIAGGSYFSLTGCSLSQHDPSTYLWEKDENR